MPNYADTYDRLAREAVASAGIRLESFVERLFASGMGEQQIIDRLLVDFDTGGPVFGRYFSDLESAGASSIAAARGQGQSMGHVKGSTALKQTLSNVGISNVEQFIESAINDADPDTAFEIEEVTKSNRMLMWVAVLRNTCHACLPLHGVVKSAQEWEELGLDPSTIHADNNIGRNGPSPCYCTLVEQSDQAAVLEPLQRVRKEKGISKQTIRRVGSKNLGVSQDARDKALESEIGRRTLRLLGQVGKEEGA